MDYSTLFSLDGERMDIFISYIISVHYETCCRGVLKTHSKATWLHIFVRLK